MMTDPEDILALPLWINGHAYLTMADAFFDVVNPKTGELLRRTPLCGADIAAKAVAAAQAVLPKWALDPDNEREAKLLPIADALEGYAAHFAALIVAETGKDEAAATAEVAEAVALLRAPWALTLMAGTVVAVVNDDREPLLGLLSLAIPALLAGGVVVAKPSPKAPSAAFAFAELTARAGLPDGVFNILQGDLEAIEGLCTQPDVGRIAFVGDAALAEKVRAIAERHGKAFVSRD
jgi:acyl-CoA reductase-like NAD-dependent aldehyde dehydrogenase